MGLPWRKVKEYFIYANLFSLFTLSFNLGIIATIKTLKAFEFGVNKTIISLRKIIAPAHRAVWRWGVVILLAMINDIARAPVGHKTTALLESNFVILYLLYIFYEIYNIIREYRNPRPRDLGLSAEGLGLGMLLICILLPIIDWTIWSVTKQTSQWSWMLLVWATALAIYLLRPRRPH
ncbi:MAG: hypothetical protein JWN01_849 [Patescibacteria group bacterium]|nr:hypothetical protein [Patescibacteria group bacterium]